MPFKTGMWGSQAQIRSQRRLEYFRQYHKRYLHTNKPEKNKLKQQAGFLARHNVEIPVGKLCEDCASKPAVLRHHYDYSKPIDVILLCSSCHLKRHPERHPHLRRCL